MKKFMKFIPVALGVLALASCSNDDFFGDSPEKVDIRANMGEGDMVVSVAQTPFAGDAFTRALRDLNYPTPENPNPADPLYFFQNGDQIRVYDNYLLAYDIYQYSPKHVEGANEWAFRRIHNKTNIGTPTFALYPKEQIIRGMWDMKETTNHANNNANPDYHSHGWIKVNIDSEFDYWADYTTTSPDPDAAKVPLYQERVPLFGKVETLEQGYLETQLEYLTGILCWETTGVPEYAKYMRVRMWDPIKEEYLPIAGRFQTDLVIDGDVQLAYKESGETDADGKPIMEVDEDKTAHISYTDLVTREEASGQDGDFAEDARPSRSIIVNLDPEDGVGLNEKDAKHVKVFVPLVCTDGKKIDLIVETSMDRENWTEVWRKNTDIERGRQYYTGIEYNQALKGHTICAINDALAAIAEDAAENSTINLVAENPIEINSDCDKLLIPNKKLTINLDFSEGIYGSRGNQTLTVQYLDPNNTTVPAGVNITAKRWIDPDGARNRTFYMDVKLEKTIFGLTNVELTQKENQIAQKNTLYPVKGLKVDATDFIFGNGVNTASLDGTTMLLSDNVESLTVDEKANIAYENAAPYGLIIPNTEAPAGYQNAGVKQITINGYFMGDIDAHAQAAPVVNLTVAGDEVYAVAMGDIRVKGKIDVTKKGAIVSWLQDLDGLAIFDGPVPSRSAAPALSGRLGRVFMALQFYMSTHEGQLTPFVPNIPSSGDIGEKEVIYFDIDPEPGVLKGPSLRIGGGVAAAYDDVTVSGQSFILGPVFSKNGNIAINNKDFNYTDLFLNGGKLSDLIYELFTTDMASYIIGQMATVGYGPLYAEGGSVKVTADNSMVNINDIVNNEVATFLNEHAQQAVNYTVYAKKDIELKTENGGQINALGDMWSEYDINFKGKVKALPSKIIADHDFAMEGPSYAYDVTVGRNATVKVDQHDGDYDAIEKLTFKTQKAEDGNGLFLTQGLINNVFVENVAAPVSLYHGDDPAFTAIGGVDKPDNLVAKNTSKWNGQQLKNATYARGNEIWTANMLAYQLVASKKEINIRSNIDLKDNPWPGIVVKTSATITGIGDQKKITGLNITGQGFYNGPLAQGLTATNLWFSGKTNIPAKQSLEGVGIVAGEVGGKADLKKITVVLTGNVGSDGSKNLKAKGIGAVLGITKGNAELKGVRVNGKDGMLQGWSRIGGLIGDAQGNVTIGDIAEYDELGGQTGHVNGLKINVTHVELDAPYVNRDLEQGKTGLYVGSADLTKDVVINTKDDKITEKPTITGAKEQRAYFHGTVKEGETEYEGNFFFKRAAQYLVGQSGTEENAKTPVKINNKSYYVKKSLSQTPDLTNALYFWVFYGDGEAPESGDVSGDDINPQPEPEPEPEPEP